MALELKQQVRLSQQLVMTPQLQQAIKLLQLNRMELVNLVQEELQENPALEEVDTEEEITPGEVADGTPEPGQSPDSLDEVAAADPEAPDVGETVPSDAEKIADVEWENYMEAYPQTGLETDVLVDEDPVGRAQVHDVPTTALIGDDGVDRGHLAVRKQDVADLAPENRSARFQRQNIALSLAIQEDKLRPNLHRGPPCRQQSQHGLSPEIFDRPAG